MVRFIYKANDYLLTGIFMVSLRPPVSAWHLLLITVLRLLLCSVYVSVQVCVTLLGGLWSHFCCCCFKAPVLIHLVKFFTFHDAPYLLSIIYLYLVCICPIIDVIDTPSFLYWAVIYLYLCCICPCMHCFLHCIELYFIQLIVCMLYQLMSYSLLAQSVKMQWVLS